MKEVLDWPAPFLSVQDEWEERIRSGPVVGMVVPGLAGKPVSFEVQAVGLHYIDVKPLNPDYYIPTIPVGEWRNLMIRYATARGEWYEEKTTEEWR